MSLSVEILAFINGAGGGTSRGPRNLLLLFSRTVNHI
jgi:hypothetical protein